MRKLKPFLAAFLLLAAIVLAMVLFTGTEVKSNTSHDGARFVSENGEKGAEDPAEPETVRAVKFSGSGRFV